MIAWIKRWWALRLARRQSWDQLAWQGIVRKRGGGMHCCRCKEPTVSLHPPTYQTAPSGEVFGFLDQAIAYACLRCRAVSAYADASGEACLPGDWSPKRFDKAQIAPAPVT